MFPLTLTCSAIFNTWRYGVKTNAHHHSASTEISSKTSHGSWTQWNLLQVLFGFPGMVSWWCWSYNLLQCVPTWLRFLCPISQCSILCQIHRHLSLHLIFNYELSASLLAITWAVQLKIHPHSSLSSQAWWTWSKWFICWVPSLVTLICFYMPLVFSSPQATSLWVSTLMGREDQWHVEANQCNQTGNSANESFWPCSSACEDKELWGWIFNWTAHVIANMMQRAS